jgi:hypothetical protein
MAPTGARLKKIEIHKQELGGTKSRPTREEWRIDEKMMTRSETRNAELYFLERW